MGAVLEYVHNSPNEISVSFESHPHALDYQDEEKIRVNLRKVVSFCRQYLKE